MIYESGRDANHFCVKLGIVHIHFIKIIQKKWAPCIIFALHIPLNLVASMRKETFLKVVMETMR